MAQGWFSASHGRAPTGQGALLRRRGTTASRRLCRAALAKPAPGAMGLAAVALAGVLGATGCRELSRFSTTEPGEAFCGSIVPGQMVRRGFGSNVRLRLTFDAAQIAARPGTLSTDDGLLTNADMRPMPELANDALWMLEFGEGRDKNLLYAVDPSDASDGPSINAVVSLMQNGEAEVRLFRSAPKADGSPPPEPNGRALYGVFAPLRRQKDSCGF